MTGKQTQTNDDPAGDAPEARKKAPGWPGSEPHWTSGSKAATGTARGAGSHVWFTIGQGALTEVYYPRIDSPCTRNLYFIITGPDGFLSDERKDADSRVEWLADGVPGFTITNTCRAGRYRIEKTVITDDGQNVLLQKARFEPLEGTAGDYRLHVYLAPHVAGMGAGNTAWVGSFKGRPVLCAQRGDLALALACSLPFREASAGFAGVSDGRDQLERHGRLARTYGRAEDGNVALIAEIDLTGGDEFVLALGFGLGHAEAAHHALSGLQAEFADVADRYIGGWRAWQDTLLPLDREGTAPGRDLYRSSAAILMAHTNKVIKGAVASLAIPWGDHRNDEEIARGAYHLVWPRDLVQHGGALLAIGAHQEARDLLFYLQVTQEAQGHWPQNMWVSGEPFWDAIQLDQAAQPILLADLARRQGALGPGELDRLRPMVRRAAGFIVRNGPATEQDRWEEEEGYTTYTLATAISALRIAAGWADEEGAGAVAAYLRETADSWDALIEGWLYVRGTGLAKRLGIDGYYARVLPSKSVDPPSPGQGCVRLIGDPPEVNGIPATEVVGVDALALVRFGLRSPDDPRIVATAKAIDALLRLETDRGPIWHRYNGDVFGERDDGSPYDSQGGVGRAWPLLIGERAHYELAAGRRAEAERLAGVMSAYASEAGMISEQVWDAPDIPERGLFLGRPTGSVMPLLWAHSEYLKLRRSLQAGAIFDRPDPVGRNAGGGAGGRPFAIWRVEHPCHAIPPGTTLRIEAIGGVAIRWRVGDGEARDLPGEENGLGVRVQDLPTGDLPRGAEIRLLVGRIGDQGRAIHEEHRIVIRGEPGSNS
ncbi:glycoside hydrolase family 15 protein [Tundrisphaera sp. TA3]|uniref:glycoside hydrolase family 15 protein n=1 Tax=Tundrisphaera sp. TA3 TaxID=3435775 RepID=UPI003EBD4B00